MLCVWNSCIGFWKQNVLTSVVHTRFGNHIACNHLTIIKRPNVAYFIVMGRGCELVSESERDRLLMAILWLNSTWNIEIDYIIAKAHTHTHRTQFVSLSLLRNSVCECVCCSNAIHPNKKCVFCACPLFAAAHSTLHFSFAFSSTTLSVLILVTVQGNQNACALYWIGCEVS